MDTGLVARPAPDPRWSTAVPDWEDRIRNGESLIPKLPLHDAYAEKALTIFKALVVPDMEGLPTHGEVCEHFAIHFDSSQLQAVDKQAVAHAVQACGSVDTLNPQATEIAFLVAAVAVAVGGSVKQRL